MFDLDGALIHFSQEAFIEAYFGELKKVFLRLGIDPDFAIKAVWAGTKAMILNDGAKLNTCRFWEVFAEYSGFSGENLRAVEDACDSFYINEFDSVKSIVRPNHISKRLVRSLAARGYAVVLATNPLFPECAVKTRLNWIGLEPRDFRLITHYANSSFSKPNPEYYREILKKINKTPEQCFMAGNNAREDMCAGDLGIETFLVTDCLENESGVDINAFRRGTLAELERYLEEMK